MGGEIPSVAIDPSAGEPRGAELDSMPMGFTNIIRSFHWRNTNTFDASRTTPYASLRTVEPYAALTLGFSGDKNESLDVAGTTPNNNSETVNAVIYPLTPAAHIFTDHIWPVITNLMKSGLGSRHSTSHHEFVRYTIRMIHNYAVLNYVLNINLLTYHFDWKLVFPFTEQVPPWLYKVAGNLNATDVGLADYWAPLMERMEMKVMFPRMAEEVRRLLTPIISGDGNGRLIIPRPAITDTRTNSISYGGGFDGLDQSDGNVLRAILTSNLDYMDNDLASASAVISTFLPFNFLAVNPWARLPIGPDQAKYEGMYNSGLKATELSRAVNDTGDPAGAERLFAEGPGSGSADGEYFRVPFNSYSRRPHYLTVYPQPTWASIRLAGYWITDTNLTDDEYSLLSLHNWGPQAFPDDDGNVWVVSEADKLNPVTHTDAVALLRWFDFVDSRYAGNYLLQGRAKPTMMWADVPTDAVWRNLRLQLEADFSLSALSTVTLAMTGSSLKEIRSVIAQIAGSRA